MAWDTERTRRRLLDAASIEFAANGLAGARIDRISERADVNRERIYAYFGGKAALFEAVLADRLDAALDTVSVNGLGPDAIGAFAGRYFDAVAEDPALARLVAWEGLESGEVVDLAHRSARAERVVDDVRRALPGVGQQEARDLFLTIVTLCHGAFVMPNLARVIAGADHDLVGRRRAHVNQSTALARELQSTSR